MKKTIVPSLFLIILVSLLSGFALSRSSKRVIIELHVKDLPQHKLRLISPSDPSFDERLRIELKGESNEVVDALKPFSVFFENKGERPVVAYLIQWCFTSKDGSNQYYQKALLDPHALMDAENLTPDYKRQSGWIEPQSARLLSLLSPDGGGMVRTEVSPKEAEAFKKGKRFDQTSLLQRYTARLGKYTEITVSIDGAFFDDGTFVGPDTSSFFTKTEALIDARKDLLNEIVAGQSNPAMTREALFRRIEETATQPTGSIDSNSTAADYYKYFKTFYASEFLQTKKTQGEDQALAMATQRTHKPWAKLHKNEDQ